MSLVAIFQKIVEDLASLSAKYIDRVEIYQKMKRLYFPNIKPNDFHAVYLSTLVELWYRQTDVNIILLFKDQYILDGFYSYLYKDLPKAQLVTTIQQGYAALRIGDQLLGKGISVEDASGEFISEFDRQVSYSATVVQGKMRQEIREIKEGVQQFFDTQQIEKYRLLRHKFETDPETIGEADIIKSLCSTDIILRRYGTLYCDRYDFTGAAALILENLDSPDEALLRMTMSAVGALKLQAASRRVIELFNHQNQQVCTIAKHVYFTHLKELTQFNLDEWLQWLHQNDSYIKNEVSREMYYMAAEGRMDLDSIKADLYSELNATDWHVREWIYRALFHLEGVSEAIDLEAQLTFEQDYSLNVLGLVRL